MSEHTKIESLVAQVKQAPALEAARLARELSKAVEQSQISAQDQFAAMSRSVEEAARESVAAMNRSAEEATMQSVSQLQEMLLRNERERASQLDAVLKRQQEFILRMVEEVKVGTVGAEIAEGQRRLLNLVETEGQLLREIRGRLTASEEEEHNG